MPEGSKLVELLEQMVASKKEDATPLEQIKTLVASMSDDDKAEAAKLLGATGHDKKDKDEKKKSQMEASQASETSEVDTKLADANKEIKELKARAAYLEAAPMVKEMTDARKAAGMDEKQLAAFDTDLRSLSFEQIKARYDNEQVLLSAKAPQAATAPAMTPATIPAQAGFNGEGLAALKTALTASDSPKTLEAMFA